MSCDCLYASKACIENQKTQAIDSSKGCSAAILKTHCDSLPDPDIVGQNQDAFDPGKMPARNIFLMPKVDYYD